jgi:hypothetical protein
MHTFSSGIGLAQTLEEVQREAESALEFAQKARFVGPIVDSVTGQLGFIRTLRGLTRSSGRFAMTVRRESLRAASRASVLHRLLVLDRKLQARFYAGDYVQRSRRPRGHDRFLRNEGLFEEADYTSMQRSRERPPDSAAPDERREHSGSLAEHHERLAFWAENCSENFADRAALVGAEIARLEGREVEAERQASRLFGRRTSRAFSRTKDQRTNWPRGSCSVARSILDLYLKRSARYQRWGRVCDSSSSCTSPEENEPAPESRGRSGAGRQLDLTTVLKVSQAVSGEMIRSTTDRLMRAALEHAGAERCLLIAQRGDELQIIAQATASGADVTVNLRDSDHTEAALPQSLVRYVMRTRDTVILDDASSQNLFSADPYLVQHRTRSVLCVPLINQGNLRVLYLEHLARAFSGRPVSRC